MKALLTEEQGLVRSTVAQMVLRGEEPVPDPGSDLPTDQWEQLAAAGFCAIAVADREGLGAMDVAMVCEALGGQLSPLPYIGACVAPTALVAAVAPDHQVLDRLADGERLAVAVDTSLGGLAVDGDGLAFDAAGAEHSLAVSAGALVSMPVAEILPTADLSRVARVLRPQPTDTIAPAPSLDRSWQALVELALCADMVGVMQRSLDMAVGWAKDRVQFGRPIGSFQAVQHLCAEQLIRLEAARSATYYAAWTFDQSPDLMPEAVATARAFIAPAALRVAETTIQVLGGIGITWESEAHLHLRRVMFDAAVLSGRTAQRIV